MTTSPSVGLKLVELFVEVRPGETVSQRIEHVVGGLAEPAQSAQFTTHHRTVQQCRHDCSDDGVRNRIVERNAASAVDDASAETDRRNVPLTDAAHTHHESQAAGG